MPETDVSSSGSLVAPAHELAEPAPQHGSGIASHIGAFIIAALLAGAGVAAMRLARNRPGPMPRLVGVGRLSTNTMMVASLSLFAGAYHVVVYSINIDDFRAPIGILLGFIAVAIGASLLLDAVENRRPNEKSESDAGDLNP